MSRYNSLLLNSVICGINTANVNVAVLQMRNIFSHNNEYHFSYLLQEQNFNPWVNETGFISTNFNNSTYPT